MTGFDPVLSIHHCTRLSEALGKSVRRLSHCCQIHDGISLSYPLLSEEGASDHYMILDGQGKVLSALALVPLDSSTMECSAFTHPSHRRKGFFSRLLTLSLEDLNDRNIESDILFPVSGDCRDTLAALDALGAEFAGREYAMEQVLSNVSLTESPSGNFRFRILPPDHILAPNAFWSFVPDDIDGHSSCPVPAGSCLTSPVSPSCLCLHHVEIIPSLRGQGLGTRMIRLLLSRLVHGGITRVVLQVSGDNLPALSLYKKTGFRITETLSYYLY